MQSLAVSRGSMLAPGPEIFFLKCLIILSDYMLAPV